MRLDGFSYLHLFEMDDLRAVFWALADIDPSEVETVAVKLNAKLRSALEEARSKGLSFPFPELPMYPNSRLKSISRPPKERR